MKRQSYVALLATLMSATAWGQDVSFYGTTMAQMWKSETPGFDKASYAPATQFLGVDATKLGSDNLSLHLFGWGQFDMADPSFYDGTSNSRGYLSYGYLQYQFAQANAEMKAGRIMVNQATGFEQVDGVSVRTDLRGGFSVSAFGGVPVHYKTVDSASQANLSYQQDIIFGARFAWRMPKVGEIGLSYLQDGTEAAKDLTVPQPIDYTRKQVGVDLAVVPGTVFALRGRTIFDVASHVPAPAGTDRSNIAEHDYTATFKLGSQFVLAGNWAERNFYAYFAGTNLPSLFKPNDNDKFQGWGGNLTWNSAGALQIVVDYRHMDRQTYGTTNRMGGEIRWSMNERALMIGGGLHVVNAPETLNVDGTAPAKSLSHNEGRIWVMGTKGKFSGSLDGIIQVYEKDNPYLAGLTNVYEMIASLGYQASTNLKVSGDLSYGTTPQSKNETRGLLKAEYRFGFGKKGGQ